MPEAGVVTVWGLPLKPCTLDEAVEAISGLIRARRPAFYITSNVRYAMLADSDPRLAEVNRKAAFLLADGKPLVLMSRLLGTPLPERVAGSDLIYRLCERAARDGHRVYLLGAAPGVADEAARRLAAKYPGLEFAGIDSPPFGPLSDEQNAAMIGRIREAKPDLLFVAFGQPRGEVWLAENIDELGPVVAAQIGASIDFAAGRVSRAPKWMQRVGLEWSYRIAMEPRRMAPRYSRDAAFLVKMMARHFLGFGRSGRPSVPAGVEPQSQPKREQEPSRS